MSNRKECIKCGNQKLLSEFIKGLDIDGKCFVCDKCRKSMSRSLNGLKKYLTLSKRNFSPSLWNLCMNKTEEKYKEKLKTMEQEDAEKLLTEKSISLYFSKMNLQGSFDDREIEEIEEDIDNRPIPKNLIFKWGKIDKYSFLDYQRLEDFEKDMIKDFRIETASHKDYLKKICKISLQMDKALDINNISDFDKLSKQYDALMKSAKFTAVQRSAADDSGGLNTFSDFFRLIEEEGFIPVYPKENRDIVDKTISYMEDYLKKLFMNDPQIMADIELQMEAQSEEEELNDESDSA